MRYQRSYGFVFQSGKPSYGYDGGGDFPTLESLEDSTYERVAWTEW